MPNFKIALVFLPILIYGHQWANWSKCILNPKQSSHSTVFRLFFFSQVFQEAWTRYPANILNLNLSFFNIGKQYFRVSKFPPPSQNAQALSFCE